MNKSVNYPFPKSFRLRTRWEYRQFARDSHQYVGQWIVVNVRQNGKFESRLGITVSRKYGKAFQRNRFKRIVREAFRLSHSALPKGLEIHIKPRSMAEKAKTGDIQNELLELLARHK